MDLAQQWLASPAPGSAVKRTRVEYRLDGVQLEVDAVDCNDVAFERGAPVHSFPSWRLKRHYDGYHWMGALGVSIGFESLTERDCLIELDRTPGVVGVASQPMWIRWTAAGGIREHYPDYFVRLDGRQAVLMDVKPAHQSDDDVRAQFDMTALFAAERGWRYVVYDAESPIRGGGGGRTCDSSRRFEIARSARTLRNCPRVACRQARSPACSTSDPRGTRTVTRSFGWVRSRQILSNRSAV